MLEGEVEEEIQGDMTNSKYSRKKVIWKSSTLEASWTIYTYMERVQMKLPYNVATMSLLARKYRTQSQKSTKRHH